MLTAFLDANPIAWKSAHYAASLPEAIDNARRSIDKLAAVVKADRVIIARSDPSRRYWRHSIWPAYKASRRDYAEFVLETLDAIGCDYSCRMLPRLESDDVLGILATHPQVNSDRVIVADDKDMLTVPGRHYRPAKKQWAHVSDGEAFYSHMIQTLMGDSGDGYPGCPGVGLVRAAAILVPTRSDRVSAWQAVVNAFELKGQTEADALAQARLARILHADDYDLERREVRLWMPPVIQQKAMVA